ncbi:PREDICTED: carotenoid 9,10(9',10')-cleavage dioxygenase 1-like [Populus euphratica]|uniref:Carotenoid 9,10(9',10')-cleavage dioxygenase 1-like n=1 Tax=Populus euphratica TaxID=75702 RepID=A0AAJ6XI42_POPEU|nr:PREDICTED: carotenoid 9,10(9',10')-cleavage dioxygenase 1-like [Populus euphratica]
MTTTSTMAFHVNCSAQRRPSLFQNIDRFKTSLSSSYKEIQEHTNCMQPLLKELKQLSLQLDVSQIMKNASVKLLDALVDSMFHFADQPILPSQVNKDLSNANVFEHSGKFYPTAPGTGELVVFGVDAIKPFMEVGVFSADGKRLVHKVDLKLNSCPLSHDMGVTERYNVIMDFCTNNRLTQTHQRRPVVVRGCRSLEYIISKSYGMDLEESEWVSGRLRSKEHVEQNPTPSSNDELLFSRSNEWRLNMETVKVKERNLTGTEFWLPKFGGLAKLFFDETSSKEGEKTEGHIKVEYHEFEGNTFCTGSAFVPKEGGLEEDDGWIITFVPKEGGLEEDEGWIITFVHDEDANTSKVYIIDTSQVSLLPKLHCHAKSHVDSMEHLCQFHRTINWTS